MFEQHEHPTEGRVVLTKPPVSYSDSPGSIRRQAPRLGQHGAEVLAELGYDSAAVKAMQDSGALAGGDQG